jgi:transcriptional regulator with XRE-family HTH domain
LVDQHIGQRIAMIRRQLGWSQEDLARRVAASRYVDNFSTSGLRKIERGDIANPRPNTLRAIADAFGAKDVQALLDGQPPKRVA